jgi:diguanylate cyclase (GGDEF)-like protein
MKIVIAEDDPLSRFVLHKALDGLNFAVTAFADGDEAWEHIRSDEAQVVISDWMMPGLDGLDLCRKVRTRGAQAPYVYLILLSARHTREDRLKALQAGADDLLAKPLDRAELYARINVARRIVQMEEQLRNRSAELERMHAELERRNVLLAEIASCDGLTGLKNHRYFRESLDAHFSASRRRGQPLSVVMVDVDQFKSFNDTYGHPAGDDVLREVSNLLRSCVRDEDVVARYGGEEFGLLLPATSAEASRILAERLRSTIEAHPWSDRPITISLGISTISHWIHRASTLIDQADRSLYQSKADGRNRLTHAWDLSPDPADRRAVIALIEDAKPRAETGELRRFIV